MIQADTLSPLVNLSTRAAVQTKKSDLTLPQAIAKTLQHEGISGLYSGLSSSLAGIAITNGVYYAFCELECVLHMLLGPAQPGLPRQVSCDLGWHPSAP
jgi:hypothetical protein